MTIASCQYCQMNKRKTFQKVHRYDLTKGLFLLSTRDHRFGMGQLVARYEYEMCNKKYLTKKFEKMIIKNQLDKEKKTFKSYLFLYMLPLIYSPIQF